MPDATWGLTGNSGTDPKTNFLGTTDEQSLIIRTNGNPVVTIDFSIGVDCHDRISIRSDNERLFVCGTQEISFGVSAGVSGQSPRGIWHFNSSVENLRQILQNRPMISQPEFVGLRDRRPVMR